MGTLSSLHFLTTYFLLEIFCRLKFFERAKDFPTLQRWILALLGVGSVVFMNFNLQMNSVGFYQLSKLCTIPTLVVFNYFYEGKATPFNTLCALAILLCGVGLFSVNDIELNIPGSIIAVIAVLVTAAYQYQTGNVQKKYNINGSAAQHASAFQQFVIGLITSIFTEFFGTKSIIKHQFDSKEIITIILSCLLAVGVNVSFFMLVGKTSPITYQVVGHLKTVLILISGFVFFPPQQEMEHGKFVRTIIGVIISMIGIILYTIFQQINKPKPVPEESKPFLAKKMTENNDDLFIPDENDDKVKQGENA